MSWPVTSYTTYPYHQALAIRNVGAQTIYIGGYDVTPTSGLAIAPGIVMNIPVAATGGHISVSTDGQLTLPKPKPTLLECFSGVEDGIKALKKSHAREMALHALAEAQLWATEAKK
jgi:hypothetical protein